VARSGAGSSGDRRPLTALDRALRLLGSRPHFAAELRRKLLRTHSDEEVDAALGRLAELGYVDDAGLARAEATRLRERRGLAAAGIAAELRRKGAGEEAVRAALATLPADAEDEDAVEQARRWLGKRSGGRAEGAALARHLARKGYGRRAIFRVLNELLPGDELPPEPD